MLVIECQKVPDKSRTAMEHRIVTNPRVLQGKPIIEGTRISVAFLLELLASGMTIEQIVAEYPNLTRNAVLAAIGYARDVVDGEDVVPTSEAA